MAEHHFQCPLCMACRHQEPGAQPAPAQLADQHIPQSFPRSGQTLTLYSLLQCKPAMLAQGYDFNSVA